MHTTVSKISSFLGKSCSEDEIKRIVEHCQIETMKHNNATNGKYQEKLRTKDSTYGGFINTGR